MKRPIAIALSGLALAAAACSNKSTEADQPSPSSDSSAPSSATTTSPPAAHVGDPLNLTGEAGGALTITLVKVINPATGVDGPPTDDKHHPNGSAYVAAMLTIQNTGNDARSDDVNNGAALIGSNNQTYTPALGGVTECTNFDVGVYHLDPGDSATGCVAFVLPAKVTPTKFTYTPSSGLAMDFGEWLIP